MLEDLKHKKAEESFEKYKTADLSKRLAAIKSTRKVRLKYIQGCTCNDDFTEVTIDRIVPGDSPYNDGDTVTELELDDYVVFD